MKKFSSQAQFYVNVHSMVRPSSSRPHILFVCLGNICRSPTAEAIATKLLQEKNLDWFVDSAGTSGYHNGELSDPRSILYGKERGYNLTSVSRKLTDDDFKNFDWLVAMDENNFRDLKRVCPNPLYLEKIVLMTNYCTTHKCTGVPDPYYGEKSEFHQVIDILEDAVAGFINSLLVAKK